MYDSTDSTRKAAFKYDALGRRIEFANDHLGSTIRYYYDGVNEIAETEYSGGNWCMNRSYVHGISYVDERLMMQRLADGCAQLDEPLPYYYVLDRMYDVWLLLDRAGAVVERWCYDEYGRPLIRESVGRGDMDNDSDMDTTDYTRLTAAENGTIWDPRADLDDDGDVDRDDDTLYNTKDDDWPPQSTKTTVAQAFSDVGNPFGFQGRVHFALDTKDDATDGKLMLVDHRNRMNDPVTGRWITRDPLYYNSRSAPPTSGPRWLNRDPLQERGGINLNEFVNNNPVNLHDPLGMAAVWLPCDRSTYPPEPPRIVGGLCKKRTDCAKLAKPYYYFAFPMCCDGKCGAFIPDAASSDPDWDSPIVKECIRQHECTHCKLLAKKGKTCGSGLNGTDPEGKTPPKPDDIGPPETVRPFPYDIPDPDEIDAFSAELACYEKYCLTPVASFSKCRTQICVANCYLRFHMQLDTKEEAMNCLKNCESRPWPSFQPAPNWWPH